MIVSRRLTLMLAATLTLVAACSGTATTPPAAVVTTPPAAATATPAAAASTPAAAATTPGAAATTPAAASGSTIGLGASAALGPILVGANGLTLYTHGADTATNVTCTGACATNWPPLFMTGSAAPTAASGVTGTIATFARADGMGTQVTYNGKPLYYWKNDKAPGDTTGQGVGGFTAATP
jgi:predicted lipoprotein with Yx(FWY)xxD motif